MRKINVVGAGVCGLSSALCLAHRFPNCDINITSSLWHPNTTSDHGFGIVVLRCVEFIGDADNVLGYVKQTFQYCESLNKLQGKAMGIQLVPSVFVCLEKTQEDSQNIETVYKTGIDVRKASADEIKALGIKFSDIQLVFEQQVSSEKDVSIYLGNHFVIDTSIYLPWLKNQLETLKHRDGRRRVHFENKYLTSLNDLDKCDLIVNCTGLGAKKLVNDPLMIPIRGQYLSLHAPTFKHLLMMNHTYIAPRCNDVAVGSVYQIGRSDQETEPYDTEDILRRAEVGFPSVRQARIRRIDVGIRPGRIGGPRVELERKSVPIIHNYGHGSRGIAQHYGCSLKVCKLAEEVLTINSKL